MTGAPYETYSCPCPRCGYLESRDTGPYEPCALDGPLYPPDPRIHLMWCGRCGKPFDAGPPTCGQVSPGTENAWLPSCCEEPPGHNGEHLGQYGETWDNDKAT